MIMMVWQFGIYSSAGTYTCGGRFGSLDYEEIDAQTYASWGVDYLSKFFPLSPPSIRDQVFCDMSQT